MNVGVEWVSAIRVDGTYPERPPFHPSLTYPEYRLGITSSEHNAAYDAVRHSFVRLGLDQGFGTPAWNPLGALLRPGQSVFIKPNLISHGAEYDQATWTHVITHGSVIRAIVDYCFIALNGKGRIIIGDGPQTDAKIELVLARTGILDIVRFYKETQNFSIEFVDLRDEYWVNDNGIIVDRVKLPGDPNGTIGFDLGPHSYFSEFDNQGKTYYGAYYDIDETNKHHSNGHHEYRLCRSPLDADLFINVPKMKTHKKVGMTLNLKSLVGINGNKNFLPHYIVGSPEDGGDQFMTRSIKAGLENKLVMTAKKMLTRNNAIGHALARWLKTPAYFFFGKTTKVVRSGNWHGNDTCWRMSLDLNRLFFYGSAGGALSTNLRRRPYLSVVDGIIGMEGDGPAAGLPIQSGFVLAGMDPLNVDLTAAFVMGFDYRKIRLLARAFDKSPFPLFSNAYDEIIVKSNAPTLEGRLCKLDRSSLPSFKPHFAWKNHIEL